MSEVALEHVTKVFSDGTKAVDDLDLHVRDGECCVLVGPSGSGKSTVLRLVAGLEEVTAGTVRIGDRVVNGVPAYDRDVAMVFEGSTLFPHLDVAGNIGFSLALRREPAVERAARVRGTAGRLGIAGLLGRRPRELAAGERQRAALGRALVRRPQAYLLDEPLSKLDTGRRAQLRGELARLHREQGVTILYVTHDQGEAMALGDRVAVLQAGHIEQVDEPRVLYGRPASLFVATFVGSPPMNLWHVRLAQHDGRVFVVGGGRLLAVPAAVLEQRPVLREQVGRHVILGLRPEVFAPAGPGAAGPVLALPVTDVEAMGSHQLVHLEAEGAGLQLASAGDALAAGVREDPDEGEAATFTRPAATLVARLPAALDVRPGQRLELAVDLGRAHVFDPVTRRALR